jgi:hypothetical protein
MVTFAFDLIGIAAIGFVSAVIMTLFEFPFWRKWGMEGAAEWQINLVMVSKLLARSNGFDQPGLSWVIASHLSHGITAGIAFWLVFPLFSSLVPIIGSSILIGSIAFSFVLWFLFLVLGRRTFESAGGIRITSRGLFFSLLSMLVYGFFLGLLLILTFR